MIVPALHDMMWESRNKYPLLPPQIALQVRLSPDLCIRVRDQV